MLSSVYITEILMFLIMHIMEIVTSSTLAGMFLLEHFTHQPKLEGDMVSKMSITPGPFAVCVVNFCIIQNVALFITLC